MRLAEASVGGDFSKSVFLALSPYLSIGRELLENVVPCSCRGYLPILCSQNGCLWGGKERSCDCG
jgi:hypothetical protein